MAACSGARGVWPLRARTERERERETDRQRVRRMESIQGLAALMVRASAASGEGEDFGWPVEGEGVKRVADVGADVQVDQLA